MEMFGQFQKFTFHVKVSKFCRILFFFHDLMGEFKLPKSFNTVKANFGMSLKP
jgi:hypothetical protein